MSLRPPTASGRRDAGEQNQQQVFAVSSAVEPPSAKLAVEQHELAPVGPAPAYSDDHAGGKKALEAAVSDARPPALEEASARGNWGGKLEVRVFLSPACPFLLLWPRET